MKGTEKELLDQIKLRFDGLLSEASAFGLSDCSLSKAEGGLLKSLLTLGLALLSYVIFIRNTRVVPQKVRAAKAIVGVGKIHSGGSSERRYLSIFGELRINRTRYKQAEVGNVYPLDVSLDLPLSLWSYLLQGWVGNQSSSINYKESVGLLNKLFDLGLSGNDAKNNCGQLSQHVEAYYETNTEQEELDMPGIHAIGFDGKGVPIILEEMPKDERPRLGTGEKRGRKKMATVSVNATFTSNIRSKEEVISGLFRKMNTSDTTAPLVKKSAPSMSVVDKIEQPSSCGNNQQKKGYDNIHRRAFLGCQDRAIDYSIQRLKEQYHINPIPIVALMDGGMGLEESILKHLEKYGLKDALEATIIDIIHVEEYVWKAVNIILGSQSSLRLKWVEDVLGDLLDSQTDKVIDYLKVNLNKTRLSENKKESISKIINYFQNHKHKMDYASYLSKGFPISTAIVESTCKHLVKDRMEGSGMRWDMTGAQNMLDMRAVNINQNWDDFMSFIQSSNNNNRCNFAA